MRRFPQASFTLIELPVVIAIIYGWCMGDFVKSTVSGTTWRALGTVAGAEVGSSDSF